MGHPEERFLFVHDIHFYPQLFHNFLRSQPLLGMEFRAFAFLSILFVQAPSRPQLGTVIRIVDIFFGPARIRLAPYL